MNDGEMRHRPALISLFWLRTSPLRGRRSFSCARSSRGSRFRRAPGERPQPATDPNSWLQAIVHERTLAVVIVSPTQSQILQRCKAARVRWLECFTIIKFCPVSRLPQTANSTKKKGGKKNETAIPPKSFAAHFFCRQFHKASCALESHAGSPQDGDN